MAGKQSAPCVPVLRFRTSRELYINPQPLYGAYANTLFADEPRRSGRANKGHHTKNQDPLEELAPKRPAKGKASGKAQAARSQSAQTENEGEDDAVIRCVCGVQRDIKG